MQECMTVSSKGKARKWLVRVDCITTAWTLTACHEWMDLFNVYALSPLQSKGLHEFLLVPLHLHQWLVLSVEPVGKWRYMCASRALQPAKYMSTTWTGDSLHCLHTRTHTCRHINRQESGDYKSTQQSRQSPRVSDYQTTISEDSWYFRQRSYWWTFTDM